MSPTYLTYRGAIYRKAATPPVLDTQVLRAAWKAIQPEAKRYRDHLQKILDQVVADANIDLESEFAAFNKTVSDNLFWAFLNELMTGTGGVDLASKRQVKDMAKALHRARLTGKIKDDDLLKSFGWKPARIPPVKYTDMPRYFDPADQYGTAYLKAVVDQLEALL